MIYLDHAAATPVSAKVLEAMKPYFTDDFFNPSAAYLPAKKVAADYEAAKATISHAIGAKANDLVITAGATEANNLAFTCINKFVRADETCFFESIKRFEFSTPIFLTDRTGSSRRDGSARVPAYEVLENSSPTNKKIGSSKPRTKVLYLETEHDSVRRVAESYGGKAIKVLPNGLIDLVDLKSKITDETVLISVALANNELGTIQPLTEISQIIREIRINRLKQGIKTPLYLHSDASQALNLLDISVARLGVDLMTINAAKVYGPKGIGALYVTRGIKLSPLTIGGGQEQGLRSGTENVPSVIGFAKAIEIAKEHLNGNRKKYASWRKILLSELQGYELINKKHMLDNFIVLCYNGIDAERLIFLLEEKGIYVATGAACAASKGEKSHVLKAIGLTDEQIAGSLRITLGETNTEEQIHTAAKIINEVVNVEKERQKKNG